MSHTDKDATGMGAPPVSDALRLVLLSTPRSGNNWLRHLLQRVFRITSGTVHSPADVDWKGLPPDFVLALHWHPTPPFLGQLREHRFRPMVLARHPLDVLVSVLHFALHYCDDEATLRWLEGEGGSERPIFAAMPRSTAFLDYATGPRARALLAVSHEWWQVPGCLRVRYEDLVRDPVGELGRVAAGLRVSPRGSIPEAVAATTIPNLQALTGCKPHFWQGRSGLWRGLLTAAEARYIASAHPAVFADLGYGCDPDPMLDDARADANWINLLRSEAAEARQTQAELRGQLAAVRRQLCDAEVSYRDVAEKLSAAEQALTEVQASHSAPRASTRLANGGSDIISADCNEQKPDQRFRRLADLARRFILPRKVRERGSISQASDGEHYDR
jgi:hypothetical protein